MNGVLTTTRGAQGCVMSLGAVKYLFARSVQETLFGFFFLNASSHLCFRFLIQNMQNIRSDLSWSDSIIHN